MEPGGSASVAGSDTQVQFNDGSTMGADAGLTYNKTTDILTVAGGINLTAAATAQAKFADSSCPGADKDVGNIEYAYVDGADGSENADFFIRGTDGGTEDTVWLQYDQSDGAWESTKKVDLGGGAFELPNGTDPNVAVTGQFAMDTDGANEAGDVSMRGFDGTNQFLADRKLKTIQVSIIKPQDMADTERDLTPIWHNNTGMVFTITEINAWSDTDNTTVGVELVTATNWGSPALVDALEIATDGTSVYTVTETTITDATIAHDEILTLDFDDTDDPGVVKVTITGWFNSDID
jgi:hypothetical protein